MIRTARFKTLAPLLAVALWTVASLVVLSPAFAEQLELGEPMGDLEPTPIASIVDDPEAFSGQDVKVVGQVSGVCEKKGCWMELTDDDGNSLRVKVEDDVLVIPVGAQGHEAAARGKVEIIDMTQERYVAWQRHLAEERDEPFDEAKAMDGPYRLVQLAGTGALVVDDGDEGSGNDGIS